jgi:DNA excision repair protein ERCC-2
VWAENNQANLVKYRKLCDVGRGAVFFVSAHSDFGRDTTFFGHYSKCVVFVGVPYFQINVEIDYKINQLKLKEIFRFKMAMRVVSRCLSNCINNPAEVKVVIFADDSFGKNDIRKKWFPFIEDGNLNTSTIIEQVARINSKTSKALAIREQL